MSSTQRRLAFYNYVAPNLNGRLRGPFCVDCMNAIHTSKPSSFYSDNSEEDTLPIYLLTKAEGVMFKINELIYKNGSSTPFTFHIFPEDIDASLTCCKSDCETSTIAGNAPVRQAEQPAACDTAKLEDSSVQTVVSSFSTNDISIQSDAVADDANLADDMVQTGDCKETLGVEKMSDNGVVLGNKNVSSEEAAQVHFPFHTGIPKDKCSDAISLGELKLLVRPLARKASASKVLKGIPQQLELIGIGKISEVESVCLDCDKKCLRPEHRFTHYLTEKHLTMITEKGLVFSRSKDYDVALKVLQKAQEKQHENKPAVSPSLVQNVGTTTAKKDNSSTKSKEEDPAVREARGEALRMSMLQWMEDEMGVFTGVYGGETPYDYDMGYEDEPHFYGREKIMPYFDDSDSEDDEGNDKAELMYHRRLEAQQKLYDEETWDSQTSRSPAVNRLLEYNYYDSHQKLDVIPRYDPLPLLGFERQSTEIEENEAFIEGDKIRSLWEALDRPSFANECRFGNDDVIDCFCFYCPNKCLLCSVQVECVCEMFNHFFSDTHRDSLIKGPAVRVQELLRWTYRMEDIKRESCIYVHYSATVKRIAGLQWKCWPQFRLTSGELVPNPPTSAFGRLLQDSAVAVFPFFYDLLCLWLLFGSSFDINGSAYFLLFVIAFFLHVNNPFSSSLFQYVVSVINYYLDDAIYNYDSDLVYSCVMDR